MNYVLIFGIILIIIVFLLVTTFKIAFNKVSCEPGQVTIDSALRRIKTLFGQDFYFNETELTGKTKQDGCISETSLKTIYIV